MTVNGTAARIRREIPPLPTSLVGSYAQPDWLIDREKLRERFPPRVRARELWRVDPAFLAEAHDDATRLAIADQERAGLVIITDGEVRRESYSNDFATALEGVDLERPGTALDRSGHPNPVPRVTGPIHRARPVGIDDLAFLRAHTDRPVKITVPGPFTMAQQAQNDFYEHEEELALAYAAAVNEEVLDLFRAGADVVQLDEPYLQARPEAARRYGLTALERALDGVEGTTCVHICFGYAAIIHERPSGYSFLPELRDSSCSQISIEAAQSDLDLSVLESLPGKTIVLGVIDLDDPAIRRPRRSPTGCAARSRTAISRSWWRRRTAG
jgi:5-methyltetrahydropteroyltriglutamate--homocysteine methyltransferase